MHSLVAAFSLLFSSASILAQPLEPRQASPLEVKCQVFDLDASRSFDGFVDAFYVQKNVSGAFSTYINQDWIQHDAYISSAPAANVSAFVDQWAQANITVLHRGILQSNVSTVHYTYKHPSSALLNVVDIYRMSGSCMAEHWGVVQVAGQNASALLGATNTTATGTAGSGLSPPAGAENTTAPATGGNAGASGGASNVTSYTAILPPSSKTSIRGSIVGTTVSGGAGVSFTISLTGLPAPVGGDFLYHIHEKSKWMFPIRFYRD